MSDTPPRTRLIWAAIPLAVGVAVAAWFLFFRSDPPAKHDPEVFTPDPPAPDPRLVFDTPFRNVKPDVKYVGDAECARCHQSITKSYHAHPMGRSADHVAGSVPIEKYDPSGRTKFSSGAFDLEVEKAADAVRHHIRLRDSAPAPVGEMVLSAHVAIGSGTRGRSYLAVEGDTVWQTPASWYGPDEKWDVSPGFRLGNTVRRAIVPECLFCHVDRVEPVPGAENRYREPLLPAQAAIGCERCHGPGELHVAERTKSELKMPPDTSIVNPRHLSPPLQLAICEQCHLQGEERVTRRGRDLFEFRPGLPFEQFVSVHVRHPDIATPNRSVGQFEQMEQSACFTKSGGRLTCTSCHDPHKAPGAMEKDAHYRQRCQKCHEPPGSKGCSLPAEARKEKNDSCIACHMPRAASANIIHASVTDHRIPRSPDTRPAPRGLPPGTLPLLRFRDGPLSPSAEERDRDFGIALARLGKKAVSPELMRGELRLFAIDRLKASLARWPGDAEAWGALATARTERGETAEKLRAANAAASLAPHSEAAQTTLTEAAVSAGEFDVAVEAAGKRIALNPKSSDPLVARAFVYLTRGDWVKAEADCRAALHIHPLHPETRLYLAICLHHLGDRPGGLREAQTAARLESNPREQAFLIDWYRRATR